MSAQEQILAVRSGAGLFRHEARGVVSVSGEDRVRWLQGMLSNDVASLVPGPDESGCYAALLTPKGKIVADLQVMVRGEGFWLDLAGDTVTTLIERLERYIIADDVVLRDESADWARLGIEGPAAEAILARAGIDSLPTGPDAVVDASLAGVSLAVARFGWSGEVGFQLFVPAAAEQSVSAALMAAGAELGIVAADADVLEILRIEAGLPRQGPELSEDVMPDEARLSRAISLTKGCYTGQEIVARLHSRGQVNHLLVGLELESAQGGEPELGTEIWPELVAAPEGDTASQEAGPARRARPIGKLTSFCQSPTAGGIGLAFVRREHAEPGTRVRLGDQAARVSRLPFEAAGVSGAGLAQPDSSGS